MNKFDRFFAVTAEVSKQLDTPDPDADNELPFTWRVGKYVETGKTQLSSASATPLMVYLCPAYLEPSTAVAHSGQSFAESYAIQCGAKKYVFAGDHTLGFAAMGTTAPTTPRSLANPQRPQQNIITTRDRTCVSGFDGNFLSNSLQRSTQDAGNAQPGPYIPFLQRV